MTGWDINVTQFMNLTHQGPDPKVSRTYLEPGRTDMVGWKRSMGQRGFASHCPGCGRWAKSVRGDMAAGSYWEWTWCKGCGLYEVNGMPHGLPGSVPKHLDMQVAECGSHNEALDRPCRGLLFFKPGDSQQQCVECNGWCGYLVAKYLPGTHHAAP